MTIIDEIKEIKEKKERAQVLLTKYRTQLESTVEKRDEYIKQLKDKFNITPEELDAFIETLKGKRDCLLQAAKEKLDKIDLP